MPMLQRARCWIPRWFHRRRPLAAATSVGARALGYENLGLLKPGYLADLILVDMGAAHFCPCNDLESDLVYTVQGSDVTLTMVNGQVLYDHGAYPTLNAALVLQRARREAEALFERAQGRAQMKILVICQHYWLKIFA